MRIDGSISYTKIHPIGVGQGMNSKVYLADDHQLGGRVAAKEIEKSRFANPVHYFQEAQAMFAVSRDNVVDIQYACHTPTQISLVMPYCRRGSLADRIGDRPLQLSEVQRVTQGLLAGLAHIHLKGYIHFDVKPSNVLFSDTNRPMVADFGQSRAISPAGAVTVPPLYMSAQPPETVKTGVATTTADIYHTGLLMYRALNGDSFYASQVPADDSLLRSKISAGKFPDRKRFMPHVPSRVRALVRKALRVHPSERFQTATEMADALGRADVVLDWSTEPLPLGGFRWRASRPDQCDLVVEMIIRGSRADVRTFTEKKGQPKRAKAKNENWRDGFNVMDAYEHLNEVFERLLQ